MCTGSYIYFEVEVHVHEDFIRPKDVDINGKLKFCHISASNWEANKMREGAQAVKAELKRLKRAQDKRCIFKARSATCGDSCGYGLRRNTVATANRPCVDIALAAPLPSIYNQPVCAWHRNAPLSLWTKIFGREAVEGHTEFLCLSGT
jgi:hypothetical protein